MKASFRRHGADTSQFDMPSKRRMCSCDSIDQVRAPLAGGAAPRLADLSNSFDTENDDGWLLIYSYFGDISTVNPDTWVWAFAAASRMLDVLEAWGADYSEACVPWRTG